LVGGGRSAHKQARSCMAQGPGALVIGGPTPGHGLGDSIYENPPLRFRGDGSRRLGADLRGPKPDGVPSTSKSWAGPALKSRPDSDDDPASYKRYGIRPPTSTAFPSPRRTIWRALTDDRGDRPCNRSRWSRAPPRFCGKFGPHSIARAIAAIHPRAAETGIYGHTAGWGAKRRLPPFFFDDPSVSWALRYIAPNHPLEGYRERCDTDVRFWVIEHAQNIP